jgi:hypothetical protein
MDLHVESLPEPRKKEFPEAFLVTTKCDNTIPPETTICQKKAPTTFLAASDHLRASAQRGFLMTTTVTASDARSTFLNLSLHLPTDVCGRQIRCAPVTGLPA